jgi:uncharacterized protein YjbJ (UPF0337 family)
VAGNLDPTPRRGRAADQGSAVTAGKEEVDMGMGDKFDNKTEELGGKVKEHVGKATDDRELEAEGHGDQAKSNLKQVGEKIKDVFKS